MHDRQHAATRHAARHRYHVLLGDTALDETIGIALRELHEPAVLDQIRIEDDEVAMTLALPQQRLLVRGDQIVGLAWLSARIAETRFGAHLSKAEFRKETVRGFQQLGEP